MALLVKREGIRQVPWFSLTEWHQVYKQIYSNDSTEQTKAYETLLAWKARIPKLPMGIDCTLSIMQVCLRDREWTPKIDNGELSISYENDLCLMYSTTIMRILNHISSIGQTKQTLFQIAKQFNIPQWIVHLRHDTAHGYELPSIGVLRIAINILLIWLHEEYWATEAKALENYYNNDLLIRETLEAEEALAFRDLIEIWTATNLYIQAGYKLVSDVPDSQLRATLQDLRSLALELTICAEHSTKPSKKYLEYELQSAQIIVLSELTRYLKKKSIPNREELFFEALFNTETFLPSPDILSVFVQKRSKRNKMTDGLPKDMITFWKDIVCMLQEIEMIEPLILRLLKLVYQEDIKKHTRMMASMWITSLFYAFLRLNAAHKVICSFENRKKMNVEILESKAKEDVDIIYPQFKDVFWFDISHVVPPFLMNENFALRLILNPNEFSIKFIPPILALAKPSISELQRKQLLNFVRIYALGNLKGNETEEDMISNGECFTVDDLFNQIECVETKQSKQNIANTAALQVLTDQNVRATTWKLAEENYNWSSCPIGILPWQVDSLEYLKPLETIVSKCNVSSLQSDVIPGFLDPSDLKSSNQINWEAVLRKKKRPKKKYEKTRIKVMLNKALETAKNQV